MAYCSVQDVADELRITIDGTTTPSDSVVNTWITQATDEIENRTGRVWEQKSETGVKLDYDGSGVIFTPYKPIISVDKLQVYDYDISSSTQTLTTLVEGRGNDFIVYNEEGEIHFLNSSKYPKAGKQRIILDYTYGYQTVPEVIRKLCTWIVAKRVILSMMNQNVNKEGGSIKIGNISIEDPSVFTINYIKFLNEQIEATISDLNKAHSIRYVRY